jgi:hypothetical protein
LLFAAMWLPWFTTSRTDPYSKLAGASGGQHVNAWQTFSTLDWLLAVACLFPVGLSWVLARDIKVSWPKGELTMIVGLAACLLILCNGVILGRPDGAVGIALSYGYYAAILASFGIGQRTRKPELVSQGIALPNPPPAETLLRRDLSPREKGQAR